MKTLHNILIVLVVITLLLTLTACGDGGDSDNDTPSCSDVTCLLSQGIDKHTGDGDGVLELTEIFATPTP